MKQKIKSIHTKVACLCFTYKLLLINRKWQYSPLQQLNSDMENPIKEWIDIKFNILHAYLYCNVRSNYICKNCLVFVMNVKIQISNSSNTKLQDWSFALNCPLTVMVILKRSRLSVLITKNYKKATEVKMSCRKFL